MVGTYKMATKEDFIRMYGEEAYEEEKEASKKSYWADPKRNNDMCRTWREAHPDEVRKNSIEQCNKGGKYYEKTKEYNNTGLRNRRNQVRKKHRRFYLPYKKIIAPESQLHHCWIKGTSNYRGIALVEADMHRYGIIDVIRILEGEITLFTEKEISEALCHF